MEFGDFLNEKIEEHNTLKKSNKKKSSFLEKSLEEHRSTKPKKIGLVEVIKSTLTNNIDQVEKLSKMNKIISEEFRQKSAVTENSVSFYKLPSDAKWEKLIIQFVDGHFVKVTYDGLKSQKFDFKDMGFLNRKTNKPIEAWNMLWDMAENNGRLTADKYERKHHKNKKYELNQKLKDFFNMKTNPIPSYTKKNGYYPLFALLKEK